ncbi:MAG: branched-chain amino acid transaminase [Pseudomonadota bacterium]
MLVKHAKMVWMDGKFVDWKDAKVHILTNALHYGLGVFEGMRCYKLAKDGSAIFRLKLHIRRLFDGLKILSMESPFTEKQLVNACIETVRVNGFDECYVRPIMYSAEGEMGLSAINPTKAAIAAWTWGEYLGAGALEKGIRAKVSSFNRHHVNIGMVQGKIIGQYVTSILAKREALSMGYDEAIMLDTHGYVAEGSGENIFAVRDGIILTPPMTSPILPGVTRDTVIALANDMDLPLREQKFTRDFLYICDEVFLSGTAAEITPVREVDNRKVGSGAPGPITKQLQNAFFDAVRGKNTLHSEWLDII